MLAATWNLLKESATEFVEDDALSRGASIAFYSVTSLPPVLIIVIAIAGIAFGEDAARGAIANGLGDLMGRESAQLLENAIRSASDKGASFSASAIGGVVLLVTASGVFGEVQSALNHIWKAQPSGTSVSRLLRARAASLGLVAALGFLLLVSLVVTAALNSLGHYITAYLPFGGFLLRLANFVISFVLISTLFAAIYKVLPDKRLEWRDVIFGAVVTSALFEIGKSLIALYIGSSAIASSYGAAGGLMIVLLWIYYSAQTFLLGAEFTKVYARRSGSRQHDLSIQSGKPA